MNFFKHFIMNLALLLAFDSLWFKLGASQFFAFQLKEIGRFTSEGTFDVRLLPAALVYILMALAIEVFVFGLGAGKTLKTHLYYGALLGFCIYGVFDLTNRAIIEHYPLPMVIVDVFWGAVLFTLTTSISFTLRDRLSFL